LSASLFSIKYTPKETEMFWKQETIRKFTSSTELCWVDPMGEVTEGLYNCVLYVKFLKVNYQAIQLVRVCKTLLLKKKVQNLEIKHYSLRDHETKKSVEEANQLIANDRELDEGRIFWTEKSRDEVHFRSLEFYAQKQDKEPTLTIVCDRDLIDMGNSDIGAWATNFLYIKPTRKNKDWKAGLVIEAEHSNLTYEMLLRKVFSERPGHSTSSDDQGTRTTANQEQLPENRSIKMSFRHIRAESQQRQLHTLVDFFKQNGIKHINIKTMLFSAMSHQAQGRSTIKFTDDEENAQNRNFAAEYRDAGVEISFDTTMERHEEKTSTIYCPGTGIKLISDEGLQFFKEEDSSASSQRPRAFSLFVLYP
jgi:hypothetical protein